jgi:hypothetical protein
MSVAAAQEEVMFRAVPATPGIGGGAVQVLYQQALLKVGVEGCAPAEAVSCTTLSWTPDRVEPSLSC